MIARAMRFALRTSSDIHKSPPNKLNNTVQLIGGTSEILAETERFELSCRLPRQTHFECASL